MPEDTLELINSVNLCQVAEVKSAAQKLNPAVPAECVAFSGHVRNLQAAVIHTYQLTAAASLREADPAKAAARWKAMSKFCETALIALKSLKESHPYCGTHELYDLTLDYRSEAERRYLQNQQDSECATPPKDLFPTTS